MGSKNISKLKKNETLKRKQHILGILTQFLRLIGRKIDQTLRLFKRYMNMRACKNLYSLENCPHANFKAKYCAEFQVK